MESALTKVDRLTPPQRKAVEARGNVLVMAGAGTGKTKTLVARCLDCLERERASLDELLIVTFTEAAAAELRQRLRRALEAESASAPGDDHWPRQLALFDIAHIGTLHSFCLRLVREHFYELDLDPQLAILDPGEARQLATETLDGQFQSHYAGADEFSGAVQNLIITHGGGRDEKIRALVLRLHYYSQTRPNAAGWLVGQIRKFTALEPAEWRRWLLAAIGDWRDEWLPVLDNLKSGNEKAGELAGILRSLENHFTRERAAAVLARIACANQTANYPKGQAGKLRAALGNIFDEARFLADLAPVNQGPDPLAEDWGWVRGHMETLLRLAQEFTQAFADRKRTDGVLDFHDLEQFALKLLWNHDRDEPTAVAEIWRRQFRLIFVDEYQDINAVQDKIIAALSRDAASPAPRPSGEWAGVRDSGRSNNPPPHSEPLLRLGGEGEKTVAPIGNRFLVGDVKQSIYRFRLAEPAIFRDYASNWRGEHGQVIRLTDNFRSRESLLNFVNSAFALLMRGELGGLEYDDGAKLTFGSPETRAELSTAKDASPRTELLLRLKTGRNEIAGSDDESGAGELADLGETEKEARLLVLRLQQLRAESHAVWDDDAGRFRTVEWRDMAVLLRALAGKSEIYAMEFERAGVPLVIARGGFYDCSEIADLLSLLTVLDNPLQDVPCIAVLRSPVVGLSLDELAEVRLAAGGHFWSALNQLHDSPSGTQTGLRVKVATFLERYSRWRKLARQTSLSGCLEQVLAETHYDDWLRSRPRGEPRLANVERLLNLAQKFDQFQRQGLFRFLKFIDAQREAGAEPEVAANADENTVRLMSIHQSKGLEFPVVAIADLAKPFNMQDLRAEIIFDDAFGLCPKVKPPQTGARYSSLPHWLAQRHQRRELAGEELRLLYVAMTRARDTLLLTASLTEKKWRELWTGADAVTSSNILAAKSCSDCLGIWFSVHGSGSVDSAARQGELPHLRWRIVEDAELAGMSTTPGKSPAAEMDLPELDRASLQRLQAALTWKYEFAAATQCSAKSSVTALRREAADEFLEGAEPAFNFQLPGQSPVQARNSRSARGKLSAAGAGTAHHKFLQHVSLENAGVPAALALEAERLKRENVLSADELSALDLQAVAFFWNSPAGRTIREQPANVKRELAFTAKFSPEELSKLVGTESSPDLKGEFIVVQGVADLVVLLPEEIWLADFKTDEFRADELASKIEGYRPQLRLYASALARIYARPVTRCWLHFLSARQTVPLAI